MTFGNLRHLCGKKTWDLEGGLLGGGGGGVPFCEFFSSFFFVT